MKLSQLTSVELETRLASTGLRLQTGPFTINLQTSLPNIVKNLSILYGEYSLCEADAFIDFHVRVAMPGNFRRWIKPQVFFYLDDKIPFKPLPIGQAMPMLEWGLNWCISNYAHQYLIMHAAVVEKNGQAVILPAQPGSGKSTLSAALVASGWRLLSDELGLIRLNDGQMVPLARPINLKNESIDIMRNFSPITTISEPFEDTNKGTVALFGAPAESVHRADVVSSPTWIINPKYSAGESTVLENESKARMFMHMAENSFNYSLLGIKGFETLTSIVDSSQCFTFTYSKLDEAVEVFNSLD